MFQVSPTSGLDMVWSLQDPMIYPSRCRDSSSDTEKGNAKLQVGKSSCRPSRKNEKQQDRWKALGGAPHFLDPLASSVFEVFEI